MRGVTKRYPGVLANDHIDLDVRPGEIHALLGENGAGKSTLMNILYGLANPDEGEILLDGEPVTIHEPVGRHRPRHQHGAPALHARPGPHRRREHPPRRRADGEPDLPRPARRARPHPEARRPVRLRDRPRRQGRLPVGRLAAAGRDPQGALPECEHPRPRRADRRADATGDAGDLRRPPPAHEGPRHLGDLHQPQAVRGPRDRRPHHRHPAREGRRLTHPVRDERGGPRRADGRPRRAADRRSRREHAGRRHPQGRATSGWPTIAATRSSTASASRSAPARSSGSPAWRATARTSWSRRSWGCGARRPAA